MHAALGFGAVAGIDVGPFESLLQLGLMPKDKVKKLHSRKEHGDKLTCVETENEQKSSSELCVNDSAGTLFRNAPYEDRDFQPVGDKVFPRFLSFLEKGRTVARVNVKELIAPGEFPPNSFTPLMGVSAEAGCMNPTPYRFVKGVAPRYPEDARQQGDEGTVVADGRATATALTQWRYEPAACDSGPVQVETILRVNYVLSR